jgi:predicted CXXCH cytochrome family protein
VTFDQGKHVHPPVSAGTCGACHNPHGSDHKKFLRAALPELCLDCHDTIKELLEEAAVTHGAVTTGRSCLNCHDPHSSNVERLLVGKPMELCLSCHETAMVEVERDEEVTEFRNGDLNLHYVHVHREKEGTSCSACHDVHGGKNPKHIVGPAPSREGAVPMVYKPSETGGSCQSGCHKMWAYDRVQAVQNE